MSDEEHRAHEREAPEMPGPPPALPDLAAVSASIDRPLAPRSTAAPPVAPPVTAVPAATAGAAPAAPHTPQGEHVAVTDEQDFATEARPPRPVYGPWALGLAIVSLAASLLVGWMLPIALVAIVLAVVALRRRASGAGVESRTMAWWALGLGAAALLYSAGWLLWVASEAGFWG